MKIIIDEIVNSIKCLLDDFCLSFENFEICFKKLAEIFEKMLTFKFAKNDLARESMEKLLMTKFNRFIN